MKKIVGFLIIALASLSCEETKSYEYQIIDSDINIKMSEQLGTQARTFQLRLATDKAYPCINYYLKTNSEANTNGIFIEILGVYVPDICLTAIGPATSVISLTDLQDKTYDIEFKIGKNISTGKLLRTSDEYRLQMDDLFQIKIPEPLIKRVPDNLIWGIIGYHTSTSINRVNEFLNSIKAQGATEINLEDGNYGYFQIENNIIKEPTESGYWFTKSFVYRFTGDKNLIKSIVKDYSINFGDLLSISVYGDKGEEFLGWILKNE